MIGHVVLRGCATLAAATDPDDPPFDQTRVLFSGIFSDHGVLQRAPARAALFGTAAAGAHVTVSVAGPNGYAHTTPQTVVASTSDPAIHGTWKVLLPARPPGVGYTITARCDACDNATAASLTDVAFGDVWLCSGQSNMEDPVLTTLSRNSSYAAVLNGAYDHIRLYQVGWRMCCARVLCPCAVPVCCDIRWAL